MESPVHWDEVRARCEQLAYPLMRADAAAAFAETTVDTGGDEVNLGVVISELERDSFANPDELYDTLRESTNGDSPLRGA